MQKSKSSRTSHGLEKSLLRKKSAERKNPEFTSCDGWNFGISKIKKLKHASMTERIRALSCIRRKIIICCKNSRAAARESSITCVPDVRKMERYTTHFSVSAKIKRKKAWKGWKETYVIVPLQMRRKRSGSTSGNIFLRKFKKVLRDEFETAAHSRHASERDGHLKTAKKRGSEESLEKI